MCGYGGYLDIARLLLDHGADLEVVDVDGDTPEILAITRGLPDMVKLFREERERLSRVSERGITRLSLARDMEGLFPPAK
jgi:ankyrin repeat protein